MIPETAPRFSGIGGHHSHAAGTVEWLTPPEIISDLGPFDLDPCASIGQPWPVAEFSYTQNHNGLSRGWDWESLDRCFGECTCLTNFPTQTRELSDLESSKGTVKEFLTGFVGASDARKSSPLIQRTLPTKKPGNIGIVGALSVCESTHGSGCDCGANSIQRRSAKQTADIDDHRLGALGRKGDPQSTITHVDSAIAGDLFSGPTLIGKEPAGFSRIVAHTAEAATLSLKTILSLLTMHNFRGRYAETLPQRAGRAIPQSAIAIPSYGLRTAYALNALCPSCRLKGLKQKRTRPPRVFLNPPYSNGVIEKWLARMAEHGHGTALIFARTETDAFFRYVWERATGILFMRGRINFHFGRDHVDKAGRLWRVGDRAPGNAGAPTVLCAYGEADAARLERCSIEGRFVRL